MNFTMEEGCPVSVSGILIFQLVTVFVVFVNFVILVLPVNYNFRSTLKCARENYIFIKSSNDCLLIHSTKMKEGS